MPATHGLSFDAQVTKWVQQTKQRQEAVFRESIQRLIEEMQTPVGQGGNMPIDTGFLRASLRLGIGPLSIAMVSNAGKTSTSYDAGVYAVTISKIKLGEVASARYIANYARRIEMGFVGEDSLGRSYKQKGYGFVRLAVQRWPTIVRQVCAELKGRATS